MCDVTELMDYLHENPPTHVILAQVYADPKATKSKRIAKVDQSAAAAQMNEMGSILGQGAQKAPKHLNEAALWAEDFLKGRGKVSQ